MRRRITEYFNRGYDWYKFNLAKILFVVGLYFIFHYLVNLPYINIFYGLLSFFPYISAWIAVMILFRPSKKLMLKVGIAMFIVDFFFVLTNTKNVSEFLGDISYLMLATYILLSLKETKKN